MPKQKWENITKASTDNREYRVIECNNGLVAALVSDPNTDKAAVALTVQVGSAADPEELQGLAHFLEHMLFLGSEKFPAENDYKKFLIEHGGAANASTSVDKTTYYLTVSPDHLEGALDRFSQFFIRPLLSPDMADREVNAVNMECERNRKIDRRRLMRLERWLCKIGHPYQKFSTGNKRLLDTEPRSIGVNVRHELLNFHERWYSANIMKVAVIGKESLDDLEDKVGVFFSQIKDLKIDPYTFKDHPYGDHETGIIYYTTPIKNRRSLELMFPCPDFTEHYASGPVPYIKYLLERTSKATLYSFLRNNFWITSKIESSQHVISRGMAKYHVKFSLTEEGLNHWDEIVHAFFQYINMIKTQCIDESIWNECARISELNFEYKEKSPPQMLVLNLVESLIEVPYEDILVADHKLTKWNPDIIKNLLDFITAKNSRIRLVSKKFENGLRDEEPIYGVRYKIEKIPDGKMDRWEDGTLRADFKIDLDGSSTNTMIPTNFDLVKPEYPIRTKPEIVYESMHSRVWYMPDNYYLLPKVFIRMHLFCAPTHVTPLVSVMACLMFSKMEDHAVEKCWDAHAAGMTSKLEKTRYGWEVKLSGYSEKIAQHMLAWTLVIGTLAFDRQELSMRRDTLKRMLMNQELDTPTVKSDIILRLLTNETKWTADELLKCIDSVTLEHMESMYEKSLKQSYCETLVYGNLSKSTVQDIWSKFKGIVPKPQQLTPNQMREDRETVLPTGNLLYTKDEDIHTSSSTLVYFHLGTYSYELAAVAELFLQYIKEPVFSVLRTKEQLAYSVQRGLDRTAGCLGLYIRLLTEKHPRFTDDRIEKLLSVMGSNLTEHVINEEAIETHKQSLIDIRRTIPKKMSAKCDELYSEIKSRRYGFDRTDKEIAIIQRLKRQDLIDFYEKFIASNAPHKRRLSIHVLSSAGDQPTYIEDSQSLKYQVINDITEFKNSCLLYPLTYVINPRLIVD